MTKPLPAVIDEALKAGNVFDTPEGAKLQEAKQTILTAIEQFCQTVIGEDEKPDVQLAANAYIYSGAAEGRNKLRAELRKAITNIGSTKDE